jgi:hypothetical protein
VEASDLEVPNKAQLPAHLVRSWPIVDPMPRDETSKTLVAENEKASQDSIETVTSPANSDPEEPVTYAELKFTRSESPWTDESASSEVHPSDHSSDTSSSYRPTNYELANRPIRDHGPDAFNIKNLEKLVREDSPNSELCYVSNIVKITSKAPDARESTFDSARVKAADGSSFWLLIPPSPYRPYGLLRKGVLRQCSRSSRERLRLRLPISSREKVSTPPQKWGELKANDIRDKVFSHPSPHPEEGDMRATGHLWIQQLIGQYSLQLIQILQATDHQSSASTRV